MNVNLLIDKRDVKEEPNNDWAEKIDDLRLGDNTYYDVYTSEPVDNAKYQIYFNTESGVIAIEEINTPEPMTLKFGRFE